MTLSTKDRHTFMAWLSGEVESTRGIIRQLERLNSPAIADHEKRWCAACIMVLKKLSETEEFTVGGDEVGAI